MNASIQLFGVRVFLSVWGLERYGEWLLLSTVLSGIAMSDIGVASATANAMAVHVGAGEKERARETYENGWFLLTVVSSILSAIIVILLWSSSLVRWLGFSASSIHEIQWTISILIAQAWLSLQTTMASASLRSVGQFAASINLATAARVLEFIAQVIALLYFGSLISVAIAGLIVRIIEYFMTGHVQKVTAPWLRLQWSNLSCAIDRSLFRPALSSMAFPIGQLLGNQAILYVISRQLGPAAIAIFSVHRTLANIGLQLVQAISHSVLPEFSHAFGAGQKDLAKRLHRRACQISLGLGLAGCVVVGLTAGPIIHIWTSDRITVDRWLMLALLVWVATRSLWYTSLFVPISINAHHRIAAVYVLGTIASLIVAIPLTKSYGLAGAAIALLLADWLILFTVLRTSLQLVGDSGKSFFRFVVGYGS